jgi:hypothetical protein
MGEPIFPPELTPEERHFLPLLRQGQQLVAGLAEALRTRAGSIHDGFQSLGRNVGLVPLCRGDTLRLLW